MKTGRKRNGETAPNQPLNILLAEDDLEMRKLLAWSLERRGYKVVECTDGTGLMRKLGLLGPRDRLESHDLIISDIRMPGATGLQVLESVREFPDFPPMILITAFPDNESRGLAQRLGAVAVMAKPFDIEDLIDKVQETVPLETAKRRPRRDWHEQDGQAPFPFDITFRHDSGSEAAKQYIRNIAVNLRPFADHVVNGRIIVDQSDQLHHKKHRYIVTLVLSTPGKPIVVKHHTDSTSENLYMAINVVFGTASRNLRHYIKKGQEQRKHDVKKPLFQNLDEQDYNVPSDSDTSAQS